MACYFDEKGFGFIGIEAGDFFFGERDVIGEVRQWDLESFWLGDSRIAGRRLVAVEVQWLFCVEQRT